MKITCLTKIPDLWHPEFGKVLEWRGELENGNLCAVRWCNKYASFGEADREMKLIDSLKVIKSDNKGVEFSPDIHEICRFLGHEITDKYSE